MTETRSPYTLQKRYAEPAQGSSRQNHVSTIEGSHYWDSLKRKRPVKEFSRYEKKLQHKPLSSQEIQETDALTDEELRSRIKTPETTELNRCERIFKKLDPIVAEQNRSAKKHINVISAFTLHWEDKILRGATNNYEVPHGQKLGHYFHAEETLAQDLNRVKELVMQETGWSEGSREPFPGVNLVVSLEPCSGARTTHQTAEPCSVLLFNRLQEMERKLGSPFVKKIIIEEIDPTMHYGGLIHLAHLGVDIDIVGDARKTMEWYARLSGGQGSELRAQKDYRFALQAIDAINRRMNGRGEIRLADAPRAIESEAQKLTHKVAESIEQKVQTHASNFQKGIDAIFNKNLLWSTNRRYAEEEFLTIDDPRRLPEMQELTRIVESQNMESDSRRFINDLLQWIHHTRESINRDGPRINIEANFKSHMFDALQATQRWIYKRAVEMKYAKFSKERAVNPSFELL